VKIRLLLGVVSLQPVIGTVWVVPRPGAVHGFAVSPRAFPVAVPRHFRIGFVLPRALSSSSERWAFEGPFSPSSARCFPVPSSDLAIRCGPGASAFLGVSAFPLRDIGQRRPLVDRSTQLQPDGPPSAFRAPSMVCSVTGLAGLFHPATACRVSLQGVRSSLRAVPGFPGALPSFRSDISDCARTLRH